MSSNQEYQRYASNDDHMRTYREYQEKYRTQIRESDKVITERVREIRESRAGDQSLSVLDIGCSTGNLLFHLKNLVPGLSLSGGDLAEGIIAECRNSEHLSGIDFSVMNLLKLDPSQPYDVIVANAVLWVFDEEEFDASLRSLAGGLKPGGTVIVFDWFHPFEQQVKITERSKAFPDGLTIFSRGYGRVNAAMESAGFEDIEFNAFDIPIDLPKPDASSIQSYTVKTDEGQRLSFRGSICQPWCHLVARRAG